jgi:hypothetical protein
MRYRMLFVLCFSLTFFLAHAQGSPPDAYVIALDARLRLHPVPSTQSETTAFLNPAAALTIIGRTQDGAWLQVRSDASDEGWIMVEFAQVLIEVSQVPVTTTLSDLPYESINFTSQVVKRIRDIYALGQTLGNRPDVFSKIGDSMTVAPHMLNPIADGLYNLGDFQYLQGILDHFAASEARDAHSSFNNLSLAAGIGWPAHAAVDPRFADPSLCEAGETPLACEYRLVRPAFALILFGANDVSRFSASIYEGNIQQIVQTSVDLGVIPILSTLPKRVGYEDKVTEFNAVIFETATQFSIPVWDYGAAMEALPDSGLDIDGIHPSIPPRGYKGAVDFRAPNLYYGYVIRNLTALQMLDAVWRAVSETENTS